MAVYHLKKIPLHVLLRTLLEIGEALYTPCTLKMIALCLLKGIPLQSILVTLLEVMLEVLYTLNMAIYHLKRFPLLILLVTLEIREVPYTLNMAVYHLKRIPLHILLVTDLQYTL